MPESAAFTTVASRLADRQTSLLEEAHREVLEGRVEEALRLLERAQEISWDARVETLMGQLAAVRHALPARAIERVRRAHDACIAGDRDAARLLLLAAMERDPEMAQVFRAAATVFQDMGCPEDAHRCHARAEELETARAAGRALAAASEASRSVSRAMATSSVSVSGTCARSDWSGQRGYWIRGVRAIAVPRG